ncbi:hypothetical protein D3C86_2135470 [compost metagenome]
MDRTDQLFGDLRLVGLAHFEHHFNSQRLLVTHQRVHILDRDFISLRQHGLLKRDPYKIFVSDSRTCHIENYQFYRHLHLV